MHNLTKNLSALDSSSILHTTISDGDNHPVAIGPSQDSFDVRLVFFREPKSKHFPIVLSVIREAQPSAFREAGTKEVISVSEQSLAFRTSDRHPRAGLFVHRAGRILTNKHRSDKWMV